MNKNILYILTLLLFIPILGSGQVVLSKEPTALKAKGFRVVKVSDQRTNQALKIQSPDGKQQTAKALEHYLATNLSQSKAGRPVVITLNELSLTETPGAGGRLEGQLKIRLTFGLEKNYGVDPLTEYQGGLKFVRQKNSLLSTESYIRSLLSASLTYFNNWLVNNENDNRKLATSVKVEFGDYTDRAEGDTIYYAANRPLTFADFRSKLRPPGNYAAFVIPGLVYDQDVKLVNGLLQVKLSFNAFLPKSASWMHPSSRNAYTLNHEQRHFDIARIIANDFRRKIMAAKLTPDTFESIINMQYLDSLRDMHVMQKAYDDETRHGLDTGTQSIWNQRIDQDLKK